MEHPVVGLLDYPRTIRMYVTSEAERTKRIQSCAKERETVEWIESLSPGVLFDIGANTGAYSFVASLNDHQVYAFEPPGPTFERLEENIELNRSAVFAYAVLLGDENGPTPFSYSSLDPGAACHSLGVRGDHVETLAMSTLDVYVSLHNLPYPEYMKIDTDGSELRVLVGAEICLNTVRSLQCEIDDSLPSSQRIPDFLAERGFTIASWTRHGDTTISNVCFER